MSLASHNIREDILSHT